MPPAVAAVLVAALLVLAVVVGVILRRREGRAHDGGTLRFERADAETASFGSRATLVQFSTEMCTRCPQVRRMLQAYVTRHDGLHHVEVDLTRRPDLSARYKVMQTPTTFVIDSSGAVRARFHGIPRPHALVEAVASV